MRLIGLFCCCLLSVNVYGANPVVEKEDSLLGRECHPGEKGTRGEPGIKYFHHKKRDRMYPFYYKGCGGSVAFYNSPSEGPKITDIQNCPGWIAFGGCGEKGDWNPQPYIGKNCSEGHYCVRWWFGNGGFCCSHDVAARFEAEETNPKCNFHSENQPIRDIDGKVLFGQNCSHNFCPAGSKCVDGEFQAYCCDEIPDRGRECAPKEKGNSGIKYYYHLTRDRIYPYYYKGCGVPSNKLFYRPEDISRYMDLFFCPGFVNFGSCNSDPVRPGEIEPTCGEGQYCMNGPFSGQGLCCSDAITARYEENRKAAKCEVHERVLKDPKTNKVIFGRSCADDFCPDGARCQQEEFESYCCEPLTDIDE